MVKKRVTASVRRSRTRSGCLTCRDRHMKCDEQQPICRNCVKSKRECQRGIRLNFTLMTVSSAALKSSSLARKRSTKSSETSDHYTHVFPRTHRYHFLDQSITIASLYKNGITQYEPYLHLHRHEDLCESDRQYQEDTMCLWSSAGLADRSAAALLPLPLPGKLCISTRSWANSNMISSDGLVLQPQMVPDYSMPALRYLTLLITYPTQTLQSQLPSRIPQSHLPPPHPLSHQLNSFTQHLQQFSPTTHPISSHQFSTAPHVDEANTRHTRIRGQASLIGSDLNASNESTRIPVMNSSAFRAPQYESGLGGFMQKSAPSLLNDIGKEHIMPGFETSVLTDNFDFSAMMGNDSYVVNPAMSNFFNAEAPLYNTCATSAHLLQRPPHSHYFQGGFPASVSSGPLVCDSQLPESGLNQMLDHNPRLTASPQLPSMSQHASLPASSQHVLSESANVAQRDHQALVDEHYIENFCRPQACATPSHLHSPDVIKFCNQVSQDDIILCMDLIENERYYWLLDLFNGVNVWKTIVPAYCVEDLRAGTDKSMFLLKCLLNCSTRKGITAQLQALTLEQQTLWNLVRHDTSRLSNVMLIWEELILSVALILLSLYRKHDTKCTPHIKVVLNNQAKLFEALTLRIIGNSGLKTPISLLVANGIQLVVILKYMLKRRFNIGVNYLGEQDSRDLTADEPGNSGAHLVQAYMPLPSIKTIAAMTSSHDIFACDNGQALQRYHSAGALGNVDLVTIAPNGDENTDNRTDCKKPEPGADLLYLAPHCYDRIEDLNVSLAEFIRVGEVERQGLILLFADLEYAIAEAIQNTSLVHNSNAIDESRELRHYFWNMIKSSTPHMNFDEVYMPQTQTAWPLREHEFRSGTFDSTGAGGQLNINERLALISLVKEVLRKMTMRDESVRACNTRIKYIFACIWKSLLSERIKKRWARSFGWMQD